MNFKIEKDVFYDVLKKVLGVVSTKSTIAILGNFLLSAKDGELVVTGTDLEVGIRTGCVANVITPGQVTVPAKKLFEIIGKLKDGTVTFEAKNNAWCEISSGKFKTNMVGLTADEFPKFNDVIVGDTFTVDAKVLASAIERTAYAISTDETKFNLSGLRFETRVIDGQTVLRNIATDGHRLALVDSPIEGTPLKQFETGITISKKAIGEMRKLIGDEGVTMGIGNNNIVFTSGFGTMVARLVDADFPDYQRVIPKDASNIVSVDRAELRNCIDRNQVMTSDKSKGIKIKFTAGNCNVFVSNPDVGDSTEDIEASYNGDEVEIGCNARYLMEALATLPGDNIAIAIKDGGAPIIFRSEDESGVLALLMPMRL